MKKLILFAGTIVLASCMVGITGCGSSDTGTTKDDMAKGQAALPPDDGKGPGLAHGAPPSDGPKGPKGGK